MSQAEVQVSPQTASVGFGQGITVKATFQNPGSKTTRDVAVFLGDATDTNPNHFQKKAPTSNFGSITLVGGQTTVSMGIPSATVRNLTVGKHAVMVVVFAPGVTYNGQFPITQNYDAAVVDRQAVNISAF